MGIFERITPDNVREKIKETRRQITDLYKRSNEQMEYLERTGRGQNKLYTTKKIPLSKLINSARKDLRKTQSQIKELGERLNYLLEREAEFIEEGKL